MICGGLIVMRLRRAAAVMPWCFTFCTDTAPVYPSGILAQECHYTQDNVLYIALAVRQGTRLVPSRLVEKILVDLLQVQNFLIPAADVVPNHQPSQLHPIDKHDARAQSASRFRRMGAEG